jgi:Chromo (CHRromatin Organisation MOdifier) domain
VPPFQVGDKVWLNRRNIKSRKPCPKLNAKKPGPFAIKRQVNPLAFELQLPTESKLHNVFHASLLVPHHTSTEIPREATTTSDSPEDMGLAFEVGYYEVGDIIDSKHEGGSLHYLVLWKDMPPTEATWKPAANVAMAQPLVDAFHARQPHKPSPTSAGKRGRRRLRDG